MSPVPIELPLKLSEAAALADLVIQHAEGKTLNEDLRNRLAARAAALELTSITPYMGSLQKDPVHTSAYYLAIDAVSGGERTPLLLRMAPASSPASAFFPDAVLIGRMRPGGGREIVVNAIPFACTDREKIRKFVEHIDRSFLPRPQGARSAISVGNRHPEISLPAAFDAFRAIMKAGGGNLASTVQLSATHEMTTDASMGLRDGETPMAAGHTRVTIAELYYAGLWSAIRAGWRDGYSAQADHLTISGKTPQQIVSSMAAATQAIHEAAGYTKFAIDTSHLVEHRADYRAAGHWSDEEAAQRFRTEFNELLRIWLVDEFSKPLTISGRSYEFSRNEILRLALKFGRSLQVNEELFDCVQSVKSEQNSWRYFDFVPCLEDGTTLTTSKELIFCLHWLKSRGRPAQLIAPNLGFKKRQPYPATMQQLREYVKDRSSWTELARRVEDDFRADPLAELSARVGELASITRHFNSTLSILHGSGKQPEVLRVIGRATSNRFNYKVSGELQLQLFDVLAEQPAGSYWRELYERMADRCNRFAAAGAFGTESQLATEYAGTSLGHWENCRTDGNLFLVSWLGNIAGSHDIHAPDGDTRFFQAKLAELPVDLAREVRRRNTQYIVWLAEQLRS